MASSFDFPTNSVLVDKDGNTTGPWMQWFNRVQFIVLAAQQSGTTANRPDKMLWVGRRYFDTTLGKPVYLKSIRPSVWVDGVGTVS